MDVPSIPEKKPPMILPLTGVRALAAVMVLFLHGSQNFPNVLGEWPLFSRGYLGVDLFFLLSGVVISHVYLNEMARLNLANARVFLWHRIIRIWPAHVVVLASMMVMMAVVGALHIPFAHPEAFLWRDVPWHLLLLQAWGFNDTASWNGPSWSVSAEWFAYLLFPLLAPILVRLPRLAALAGSALSLGLLALGFISQELSLAAAWNGVPPLARISAEFLAGALAYRALLHDGGTVFARRFGGALAVLGLAGFLAGSLTGVNDFVLLAALLALLVGLYPGRGVMAGLFSLPLFVWLGELSYSIYIVHSPILLVTRKALERLGLVPTSEPMRLVLFLAVMAIILLAATLLHRLVEKPFRQLWRDRYGRINGQAVGATLVPELRP